METLKPVKTDNPDLSSGTTEDTLEPSSISTRHLKTEVSRGLIPVGALLKYPRRSDSDVVPDGFLRCDARDVSRSIFRALFGIFGTEHGVGDGSTTFGLPNDPDFIVRY